MTPDDCIAQLDYALGIAGEQVRLLRMAAPPASGVANEVDVQAMVRGYAPSEIVQGSGITQQDQLCILSPTTLVATSWPAPGQSPVPKIGDRVVSTTGRVSTVMAAAGITMGTTLVRIELQIRGMGL